MFCRINISDKSERTNPNPIIQTANSVKHNHATQINYFSTIVTLKSKKDLINIIDILEQEKVTFFHR